MCRRKIFIVLSVCFIFLGLPLGAHTSIHTTISQDKAFSVSYITSDSIEITSNSDFLNQGWPGTGTLEDPYVIENLQIISDRICISISGTTDHFIIKNCSLNSEDLGNGITHMRRMIRRSRHYLKKLVSSLSLQEKSVSPWKVSRLLSVSSSKLITLPRLNNHRLITLPTSTPYPVIS